jgi:hypothetical protein
MGVRFFVSEVPLHDRLDFTPKSTVNKAFQSRFPPRLLATFGLLVKRLSKVASFQSDNQLETGLMLDRISELQGYLAHHKKPTP